MFLGRIGPSARTVFPVYAWSYININVKKNLKALKNKKKTYRHVLLQYKNTERSNMMWIKTANIYKQQYVCNHYTLSCFTDGCRLAAEAKRID